MTDEEFERLKEAEKERLRTKKRLRATLKSLKRRNEVQSVVRRMSKGAKRLLEQTEALADKVASQAARQAARLEVATEMESGGTSSFEDAEETLREERAEALVRRFKAEEGPRSSPPSSADRGASSTDDDHADDDHTDDGPDKTIGRMGDV